MFNHTHYVPALKLKQGEQAALANLPATSRAHFTPMLEVEPPTFTKKRVTVDDCVMAHIEDLAKCWDATHRLFVDLLFWEPPFVSSTPQMASGLHPLEDLVDAGIAKGLKMVDVVPSLNPAEMLACRDFGG